MHLRVVSRASGFVPRWMFPVSHVCLCVHLWDCVKVIVSWQDIFKIKGPSRRPFAHIGWNIKIDQHCQAKEGPSPIKLILSLGIVVFSAKCLFTQEKRASVVSTWIKGREDSSPRVDKVERLHLHWPDHILKAVTTGMRVSSLWSFSRSLPQQRSQTVVS